MKRQDLIKYHHQDIPELQAEVLKLQQQLVDARLKIQLEQERNLHLHKNIRQDIARLKTIIRHKQLTGKVATTAPKPTPKATSAKKLSTTKKNSSNKAAKKSNKE